MTQQGADPWGALQGGAEAGATAQEPDVRSLAYADGDAVGFYAGMVLPPVCVKCATEEGLGELELRLKVKSDQLARLGRLVAGEEAGAHVAQTRLRLRLPRCGTCQRRAQRTSRLRWSQLAPPALFVVLLAVILAAGAERLVGPLALASLAAFVGLVIWWRVASAATDLVVEGIDEDGIVRISGVHHDAAAAIVRAATGRDD
jgi:hypothetical protein